MICVLSSTLIALLCISPFPDLYRLTTASTTSATSTPFSHTYTYTALGNIASSTNLGEYTYAETNYANPHAPTSIGGHTLTYDSNGNLSSYLGTSYAFDYKNRLTQTAATTTTTYGYDHTTARVFKYDGTATTTYPNKYFSAIAATTTRYIFLPDGDLVATIEGNGTATTTQFNHSDHLGSTNAVTNTSGALTQLLDYYPYGAKRIERGSDVSNREYIGQHFDEETDLSYLNARYYDGTRGQFTSQDPSFLDIGGPRFEQKYGRTLQQHLMNPQALNSYSYALNNPVTLSDPEGEIVPILIAAYAAFEIGLSAYDAYTTAQTIADPNASFGEKAVTGSLFIGGLVAPGGGYAQVPKVADKAGDAARTINNLSDSALVCRGGLCGAKDFIRGNSGPLLEGKLTDVSVTSAPKASLIDLTRSLKQNQVGVTTVGDIRKLGGDVIRSPGANPFHATLQGITPQQAQKLFTPTIRNPSKVIRPK